MPAISEAKKKATAAVGGAGSGSVLGDIAEGNGLDKIAGGLQTAADAAGGVLNDIFGALPWEMGAQETAEAAGMAIGVIV